MGADEAKRIRAARRESKSENPTLRRLAGTPFKTATELNEAEARVFRESWEELTKAKSYESLTEKPDFAFFKRIFEAGLRCRYGMAGEDDIVRVCLKGEGMVVEINADMRGKEHDEKLVASLAQSLSATFFTNYLKAMRIIPATAEPECPDASKKK